MTSKQRAYLRSLASTMQPLVQVGKNGITEALLNQINEMLELKELIKISVLKNVDFIVQDIAAELSKSTNSLTVQVIGSKITLYRISKKKDVEHIVLPS